MLPESSCYDYLHYKLIYNWIYLTDSVALVFISEVISTQWKFLMRGYKKLAASLHVECYLLWRVLHCLQSTLTWNLIFGVMLHSKREEHQSTVAIFCFLSKNYPDLSTSQHTGGTLRMNMVKVLPLISQSKSNHYLVKKGHIVKATRLPLEKLCITIAKRPCNVNTLMENIWRHLFNVP